MSPCTITRLFDEIKSLGTRRLTLLSVLACELLAAEVLVMPPL